MGRRVIRVDEVEALFARAPFEAAGWDKALRGLATATGSSRAQLVAMGEQEMRFNWVTDITQNYVDEFIAIEGYRPEVNYRVAASTQARLLELRWEDHYDEIRASSGTNEIYIDHVKRWDAEHGAQMTLANDGHAFFGLAALHSASDGRTTEGQREVLRRTAPAVLAAISVQRAVEHQGVQLLCGSLDALRSAALILDARGRVRAVTPSAERLLGPDMLQVRGHRIRATNPQVQATLSGLIGQACEGQVAPAQMWIRSQHGPVRIEVCGLPAQEWGFGFAPRVIVTLRTPQRVDDKQAANISEALGLTPAEGEIVALLALGHARTDIALRRGVSAQTVSSQLRTIFLKTGVNREAELVSIGRAVIELGSC